MKKKHIVGLLFAVGLALLFIALLMAVIETADKNIIGGADLDTFFFVLYHGNNGLYSSLTFVGVLFLVGGAAAGIFKRSC